MPPLTFGSLFDGISCFSLGLRRAGLSPSWLVEVESDCRRVTAARFPGVPQFGDVRECGRGNLAPVDVIVGGFPCQDLSVAGKRAGMKQGNRSGLWWEMLRVVTELQPRLVVWENVPGLLSSDGGRDFLRVVSSLAEHGYFGCVRTLDARYFGVAQRRRRLFGVFARGSAAAERACEILAVREGRERHPPKGREAGARVAPSVTPGARRASGQRSGEQLAIDFRNGTTGDVAAVVQANGHGACPGGTPHVYQANGAASERGGAPSLASSDDNGSNQIVTHTLRPAGCDAGEDGTGRGTPLVVAKTGTGVVKGLRETGDTVAVPRGLAPTTLPSGESRCRTPEQPPAASPPAQTVAWRGRGMEVGDDVANAVRSGGDGHTGDQMGYVLAPATVIPFEQNQRGEVRDLGQQSGSVKAEAGMNNRTYVGVAPVAYNPHRTLQKDGSVVEGFKPDEITDALHGPTGNKEPLVMQCHGNNVGPMGTVRQGNGGLTGGVPFVVRTDNTGANQGPVNDSGTMDALDTGAPAVAFNWQSGGDVRHECRTSHTDALHAGQTPAVTEGMVVRRLTPVECLRLQGLPDDWLDLDPPLSDSAKYRMIGNGGAVPVMTWIGRRIVAGLGA